MKISKKQKRAFWIILHILIIVDIILISIALIFDLPTDISSNISRFDFILCIILLIEWFYNFYHSESKTEYITSLGNWMLLIAAIPFEMLLPAVVPSIGLLRFIRLFKLLRIILLFNRFFDGFDDFLKKSNLDKVIVMVFITALIFTLLLNYFGSSYGVFDDFYFVIVTLATVGYGDVAPKTFDEKVISIFLIIVGIILFSTLTASISSYLTDRLIKPEEEQIGYKIDNALKELNSLREENKELYDEINELKELIKNK